MLKLTQYNCTNFNLTYWIPLAICGLLSLTAQAAEQDTSSSDWRWHGFANQGVIKTSGNSVFGDSENWSTDFHDVGLGGSWKPHSRLHISAQGIYRRAGDHSEDGVQLDYGFIDLNLLNNMDYGLGFRAGRVKNTYGFYNDTRDVTSNRPSILLPQSIYLDSLRQLFHTMDGVSSYSHAQWGDTLLNLDLVYGKPIIDEETEAVILNFPLPGDIEDEKMLVARAMLEQNAGQWRIGYSFVQLNSNYQPGLIDFAIPGEANIQLNLFSFEYNWADWQFTAEYQQRELEYKDIFFSGNHNVTRNESYYTQVSYQISPQWKAFARYDAYFLYKDDKNGRRLAADTGAPNHLAFTKDHTVGMRYDINKHWAVAAEYHRVKGTGWLAQNENLNPLDTDENWDLFTAQVSFKF